MAWFFCIAHATEVDTPEDRDFSMEIGKPISRSSSSSSPVSIGSQEGEHVQYGNGDTYIILSIVTCMA
jgi:hypothetical protein